MLWFEWVILILDLMSIFLDWRTWVVLGILGFIVGSILFTPIGGLAILAVCLVIAVILYFVEGYLNKKMAELELRRIERRNQKRMKKQNRKLRRQQWRKELWTKFKAMIMRKLKR